MNFNERLESLKPHIKTRTLLAVDNFKANKELLKKGNLSNEEKAKLFDGYFESYRKQVDEIVNDCTQDLRNELKPLFGFLVNAEIEKHSKEVHNILLTNF
jgi:polyhydroxyalkanoate synthesis regulator phasin